jgi:putative thiamine transport system ATP-binding protein
MSASLVLEDVRIGVSGRPLLALDAAIAAGEVLTVMGPSGAGKSSLLSFIAGLAGPEFVASGRVLLDGEDVSALPAERRRIGLLFQDALLFPHLSVGGNVLFGLPAEAPDRRAEAEALLADVGLAGTFQRDPETLSGGERARVALVRLLASRPRAVLLDEPFSKLDTELRAGVRALVFARLKAAGLPCVLVTHDQEDASVAGGRIVSPWLGPA